MLLVMVVTLTAIPAWAVALRGLSLNDVMASHGFGAPSEYGRSVVYRSRFSTVVFEEGTRRVTVDGMTLYLNRAVDKAGRTWVVSPIDAADTLGAVFYPVRALKIARGVRVVIDPGHGGEDPGASGSPGFAEKRLTLDMAKRIKAKLRESGVNVWLTRDGDSTLSLEDRCRKMSKQGADVFVSIHFNASRNQATCGVETYIVPAAGCPTTAEEERRVVKGRAENCPGNKFDSANVVLASYVHKGLVAHSRAEDRGIRRARFYVIRNATCPAILVECGFLSNRREMARIEEEPYRAQLAEGISRGILTYLYRVRELHQPPVFK